MTTPPKLRYNFYSWRWGSLLPAMGLLVPLGQKWIFLAAHICKKSSIDIPPILKKQFVKFWNSMKTFENLCVKGSCPPNHHSWTPQPQSSSCFCKLVLGIGVQVGREAAWHRVEPTIIHSICRCVKFREGVWLDPPSSRPPPQTANTPTGAPSQHWTARDIRVL